MTNEEKAREISSKYIYDNQVMHHEYGDIIYEYETFGEETEDAALEMAKWKDQQFKEYLEKKLEWARGNRDSSNLNDPQWHDYVVQVEAYREIINELFREE